MNPTDLQLYELLWDKTLKFGCLFKQEYDSATYVALTDLRENMMGTLSFWTQRYWTYNSSISSCEQKRVREIIWHEPTLTDFHRWLNERGILWFQDDEYIEETKRPWIDFVFDSFSYISSLTLLEQPKETKQAITDFISSHS